jgi:hypothetical protein
MIRRLIKYSLLFVAFYILLGHLYVYWTGDFRVGNILLEGPNTQLSAADVDLEAILAQPFYYLNKGNQTYALVSKDGKVVLKLFKRRTLDRTPLTNIFPPTFPWVEFQYRSDTEERKKRERIFVGYQLAYEKDRENTGIVYLSFGKNNLSLKAVITIDSLGVTRIIDLNSIPFVIQTKAKTTRQILKECLERKDIDCLNEKIHQLFVLYISEYEKGIMDKDHNFLDNTGFVNERAIRLDVGKLVYDEKYTHPEIYEKDFSKIKKRLKDWICRDYPQVKL